MYYSFRAPDGTLVYPVRQDGSDGRWRWGKEKAKKEAGRIEWVNGRNGWAPYYRIYSGSSRGRPPETIWNFSDAGSNRKSKAEIKKIFGGQKAFDTPKPEKLLQKILDIATNPGDLVLDSFLGSGTTAAVAHKMGRRYIGIEMGDHAVTHCVPRLRKVIEGEQGGISQAVNWQGGGGFRFYRLGEPVFDAEGRLNPAIRFATLAAHVWFAETGTALRAPATTSRLGIHNGTAIDLLYNGILGDRRPDGGNVLTSRVLEALPPHDGPRIIYGGACRLSPARLKALNIAFRQTPYDLKIR
jgi:adenine-specific DNA-methyltransferase